MTRAALLFASSVVALLGLEVSCGYTVGRGGAVRSVTVAPVSGPAIDVDALAFVERAVREALARSPSTVLVNEGGDMRLEIELVGTDSPLLPFADPGRRSAQYRSEVRIRGRLYDRDGRLLFTSDVISGDASHLSFAGRVEAIDGSRRAALERAAADAADRLVAALP